MSLHPDVIPSLNRAARRRADRDDERRKQQMLAWRKEFEAQIGKIEAERDQLRAVCRDFLHALEEYAKGENWASGEHGIQWVGEGDGPGLARRALGMNPEGEPVIRIRSAPVVSIDSAKQFTADPSYGGNPPEPKGAA
jgi:hypothetical protein